MRTIAPLYDFVLEWSWDRGFRSATSGNPQASHGLQGMLDTYKSVRLEERLGEEHHPKEQTHVICVCSFFRLGILAGDCASQKSAEWSADLAVN